MLYSLGYQDFRSLREDGRTYVDKTEQIARILDLNKYLFLARPRRFGKSLTVSTLAELHSNSRELFDGLWAQHNWDFEKKHSTVIWLQFASSGFMTEGLDAGLHNMLDHNAHRLGLAIKRRDEKSYASRFAELIQAAANVSPSGKTVLLIDEYDKPIVHYIGESTGTDETQRLKLAATNRDYLKSFYSVLKDADPHLGLVFITGVSAFSKVSIFSDLNNVTVLTLHTAAATLVGITQAELEKTYTERLDTIGIDKPEVRSWYNGYKFAPGGEKVYNPWSLLSFLAEGRLRGYWYATGTPTWLTQLAIEKGQYDLDGIKVGEEQLTGFDFEQLTPTSVLFQTGYLTIIKHEARRNIYTLGYPNIEVRAALELGLLGAVQQPDSSSIPARVANIEDALVAADLSTVIALINVTLADVPYQLWTTQKEAAFHLVVHVLFKSVGVHLQSEVSSARGRADAIIETPDRVYCFEFKVAASADTALAQIRERGYLDRFLADGRKCTAVGVSFDAEKRCVSDWRQVVLQ